MNRDKFLQWTSAVNLEGSATTEEAAEALMRATADPCGASMPCRQSTYHRKPAYRWNEELAGLRNEYNKHTLSTGLPYKEARRTLRIAIRKCKTESWKTSSKRSTVIHEAYHTRS